MNTLVKIKLKMRNKKIIVVACALMISGFAQAQEFKITKNSGRLELNLGRVTVEGHAGNEIIFTSKDHKGEKDERAQGLKAINSLGLEDNTGLGIHVADKGNVVAVYQLKRTDSPDIKILVPKGIIISFTHETEYGGEAKFINLTNEIEVSATYNSIELDNVTGPLAIETTYGHVEAIFDTNIKDPISIVSIYGYVDVTLPQATKANLKLSTSYGDIFVAPEFKINIEPKGGLIEYSDKVVGTINGGGINVDLNCSYGKIYLRKK
jgi:predicted membrane protein